MAELRPSVNVNRKHKTFVGGAVIHLNIDSDLDAEVRKLAQQFSRPVGTVASALMRLGLKAKVVDVRAMVDKCARPIGRPIERPLTPAPEPKFAPDSWEAKLRKK